MRSLGAIVACMVFLEVGPQIIIGPDTGSFVFYSLICTIIAIGIYGCGLLPLLTEFGLMDFVGTLVSPLMRKVFRLPGRAAVDCLSSWLGATSLGVIITNGQLEKGYYTQREAASIATNFSAVSIAFALVVLTQVGLEDQFFTFYLTVGLVAIVSAIILNRIPPLSRKPDTYMVDNPAQKGESLKPEGYSLLGWAWHRAVMKGNDNGYTVKSYMTDWAKNSCLMLFGILGNDRIALHALPGSGHLHYAGAVPVRQRGDDPHHQDQSKPAGYVHHLPGAHYRQPHRGQSVHLFFYQRIKSPPLSTLRSSASFSSAPPSTVSFCIARIFSGSAKRLMKPSASLWL